MRYKNYSTLSLVIVSIFLTATGVLGQSIIANDSNGSRSAIRASGCGDGWDTTFTTNGADNQVNVIVSDGSGGYYVGGRFSSIQGVPASGIAKWNGSSWTPLGSGINGSVYAIAVSGNDVYVAGGFSVAGGIPAKSVAKWDGTSWSALGAGLGQGTHYVKSVAVYGNDVYFGGNFSVSDGSPGNGIVKWDGTSYSALPISASDIRALAVNGGSLYAGGFVAPTPAPSVGIVKFDGINWTALGTLANTTVSSIAFSGTEIYVGGDIRLTGQSNSQVARLSGTTWTGLAFFSGGLINAVAVHGGELYVGGYISGSTFNNLAKFNGSNWVGVGSGITGGTSISESVMTLSSFNNTLYVGGNYTTAGGQGARNMASYASGNWSPFHGTGLDGAASAIAVSGPDVYVAGGFTSAGTVTANRIAKWNGVTNTWSALGTGVIGDNTSISAVAVAGGRVYAGGNFSNISSVNANGIAVWNGTTWAPLGTGVGGGNGRVSFIIVRGDDVYVGGDFTTAGGVAANRVAKWNGTTWSGLNSPHIPTTVSGMTFMGNDLYVSTGTTTIANPAYFSKYDGTTWTLLGGDLGDRGVSSIASSATDVYVTGGFTTINGITVNRIAKWNGTLWSALGNGLPPATGSSNSGARITVSGNDVIATGEFTVASGAPADRIAKWDGMSWTGFSTGLNAGGSEVKAAGGDIFVGGSFTRAGCNTSPYFARWRQNVWNGSTSTDWHTSSNWGGGTVPPANAGISIGSNNISISSSDVTVSSLIVTGGRSVTVATGRTLTVTGNLDLSNGSLAGPGTVVVSGDVSLNGGNITGLAGITINGNLYLGGGTIAGTGSVAVTSCRTGAVSGGSATSFVNSPLTRCVDPSGTYRFPVGVNGVYAPVDLSAITGTGNFTVEPKSGAFAGAATGLPALRLQRWWNITNGGIIQANLTLNYTDLDVVGIEGRYRAYSIVGGNAQILPTVLSMPTNKATVSNVTSFGAITLAEGPATFETLSGRITTPRGRGAERVIVTMTDSGGNIRYAFTNMSGYYRFYNVETWKTYTIRLLSKRHTFTAPERVLEFIEGAPTVNFVSTDH